MAGGVSIPAAPAVELVGMGLVRVLSAHTGATAPASNGPFRPPQWSQQSPMTMITVPAPYVDQSLPQVVQVAHVEGSDPSADGMLGFTLKASTKPKAVSPQIYVFDAVFRASHSQRARPTQFPVQSGANMTDHVVLEPAHLSLDIGMSDVIAAFQAGQWVGNPSKSISCFTILDGLRAARIPLTVTTRLKTYQNMVIEDIRPDDNVKTRFGLRATVEFQQIFTASVAAVAVSARQQTTDSTSLGTVQPVPPSPGVTANNQLPSKLTGAKSPAVLKQTLGSGASWGSWSSNNTAGLNIK